MKKILVTEDNYTDTVDNLVSLIVSKENIELKDSLLILSDEEAIEYLDSIYEFRSADDLFSKFKKYFIQFIPKDVRLDPCGSDSVIIASYIRNHLGINKLLSKEYDRLLDMDEDGGVFVAKQEVADIFMSGLVRFNDQ